MYRRANNSQSTFLNSCWEFFLLYFEISGGETCRATKDLARTVMVGLMLVRTAMELADSKMTQNMIAITAKAQEGKPVITARVQEDSSKVTSERTQVCCGRKCMKGPYRRPAGGGTPLALGD